MLTEVGRTKNFLHNGDFEDWTDTSAPPPGWGHIKAYQGRTFTGRFCREGQDVHSGAAALRLANDTNDEVHLKQVLPVNEKLLSVGRTYRLSF